MNVEEAHKLAQEHITKHCPGWRFVVDTSPQQPLGQCRYSEREIALTRWFIELNEKDCVEDTILHEIAHALTPGHGHDGFWQAKCLRIGCSQSRFKTYDEWPDAVLCAPDYNFTAACPECGRRYGRVREPKETLFCTCLNGWHPERTVLVFEPNPHARNKRLAQMTKFEEELVKPKKTRMKNLRSKLGRTASPGGGGLW